MSSAAVDTIRNRQRLQANRADPLHVGHLADARDDRAEHDRRDHHLDQFDEAVAERPHRRAAVGRDGAKHHAGRNADQDLDVQS